MVRILVVDDDLPSRTIISGMLEDAGYDVTVAVNGNAAIGLHRAKPFDLIVTDLLMPEKEGIETIVELREQDAGLKIIAMSSGDYENLLVAKLLGAMQVLVKPFSGQQLVDMVRLVLD